MAAKTLKDAIVFGISISPENQVVETLTGELRDFESHQVMKLQNDLRLEGHSPQYLEIAEAVLHRYFDRIFPAGGDK